MSAVIRMLVTDLDGTLIGSANELPAYGEFHAMVEHLRENYGMLWIACTGRTFRSFWDFFLPMRRMGILPDYVVIRHAYLFRMTAFGFLPHVRWNLRTLFDIWQEVRDGRRAIQHWQDTILGRSSGVRVLRRQTGRLSLRFDSEESAMVAADYIGKEAAAYRHLKVFVTHRDVDVRFVPATKGMAVSELARRLDVPREEIMAIGNGQNDISMLDGTVAAMTGCPANSEEGVRATVHRAGGHLARQRSLFGVLEVLEAYESDMVNSEPGEDEVLTSRSVRSASHRVSKRARGKRKRGKNPALVFLAILITAVLAVASVGALPGSALIMKPVDRLFQFLMSLLPFP